MHARPSIVAFCVLKNKKPPFSFSRRPQSDVATLRVSQNSNSANSDLPFGDSKLSLSSPLSFEEKDWFMDGKDAARQLKLDLGIVGGDKSEDDPSMCHSERKALGESMNVSSRNDILESGRAAALELLEDMKKDSMSENKKHRDPVEGESRKHEDLRQPSLASSNNTGSLQTNTTIASTQKQLSASKYEPSSATSNDKFDIPSRKSHCMTVCLVPHTSSAVAWEQLTAIRRECKDPGFFRWPPHANILYPFLEPSAPTNQEEDNNKPHGSRFQEEVTTYLKKAAEQCEPFDVTIDSFGTFGGKQRGVLWAYPKSNYKRGTCDEEEGKTKEEPLIRLHRVLEEQFPLCKDQRKASTVFRPHMTVSHYENNDRAVTAMKEIQSRWKPVTFHVTEVYLLERKGDSGQFKISATIPLGVTTRLIEFHDPPVTFLAMPEVEDEWVYKERMAMKRRRKNGFRRTEKKRE